MLFLDTKEVTTSYLESLPADELRELHDLVIVRPQYGSIRFLQPVDLHRGLDFSKVVTIKRKEVVVYGDENKPPEGEELNVRAHVTLYQVFPTDKATRAVSCDVM